MMFQIVRKKIQTNFFLKWVFDMSDQYNLIGTISI